MRLHLSGLIAAPFSPMHEDGRIDLAAIEHYARLLAEAGVMGAFVCGSTGESHSLSTQERMQIAESWMKAAGPNLAVIIQVGHNSLPEARALAAHAQRIGAGAISAMAPSYFKPACVDDLIDFFAEIAASAPILPFFFYDIPSMTGVNVSAREILEKSAERIPTLAGIKFTNPNLMALQECLAFRSNDFTILFGIDEILLSGLVFGCPGAVGSTYNYAAPVYHRIIRAFQSGDMAAARREQLKSVELVHSLHEFGGLRAGKAIIAMMGMDCGPVRLPLRRMTVDETRALYDRIHHLDIFSRPLTRP
ncbi:MAG: dihydrodipicolinate synthase family protein [Verrucomicrobia bacterium]|nr:dihydrodipicolinate synthase family protein [Verrucomicrobiota bacterium]